MKRGTDCNSRDTTKTTIYFWNSLNREEWEYDILVVYADVEPSFEVVGYVFVLGFVEFDAKMGLIQDSLQCLSIKW